MRGMLRHACGRRQAAPPEDSSAARLAAAMASATAALAACVDCSRVGAPLLPASSEGFGSGLRGYEDCLVVSG